MIKKRMHGGSHFSSFADISKRVLFQKLAVSENELQYILRVET
jgi:hypothetical protein